MAGSSQADIFDDVWHDVAVHYSMLQLKGVDWDSVGRVYRPLAIAAATDSAFASALGAMLASLRDRHVSLTPGSAATMITYRSAGDTVIAGFDASVVGLRYLGGSVLPLENLGSGHLSPAIGYVRIPNFDTDHWGLADLDDALLALGDVQSLVLDVRGNAGGSYDLALAAAGRFADQKRQFGSIRVRNGPRPGDFSALIAETVHPEGPRPFHGPVFVLTNRRVYSSGEDFVLAMRSLPGVTMVGDTTGGSSGKPIARELPNGWTYELSTWLEYTMAGVPYEDIGLSPGVYERTRLAELHAGVDAVLDRAMALAEAALSAPLPPQP